MSQYFSLSLIALFVGWLASSPALVIAAELPQVVVDVRTLQAQLIKLSKDLLEPEGFHLDEQRLHIATSRPLTPGEQFIAMQRDPSTDLPPSMPMVFELRQIRDSSLIQATLSAPLERDVLVSRQRIERGTTVTCDDIAVLRKPLRFVPQGAMLPPCALSMEMQSRRTLLPSEVLREVDVRPQLGVAAQTPVNVRVTVGQISLDKPGIALADAKQGERVRVQMKGSTQPFNGRVAARNLVVLEGSE